MQALRAALAVITLLALPSCDSAPSEAASTDASTSFAASEAYNPAEQALIGSALRRSEKGVYTAKLIDHYLSKTSSTVMMCGTYILTEDGSGRLRYFISTTDGAMLLDSPQDARWQKYCSNIQ